MSPLIGEQNYMVTNLKAVTSNFNKSIFSKLLIHIEEVDDNRSKTLDRLKELTKRVHHVDEKFIEKQQVTKYFGFVITSNKRHPIRVETTDRRHFFTSYSKVSTDTPDFMFKLFEWLKNENGLQEIYDYLWTIDITNFDVRDCPLSETKTELMEIESFAEQGSHLALLYVNEHLDLLYKPRELSEKFKITGAEAQQVLRQAGFEATNSKRWIKGKAPFVLWKHTTNKFDDTPKIYHANGDVTCLDSQSRNEPDFIPFN
jgi:hypothetical protein